MAGGRRAGKAVALVLVGERDKVRLPMALGVEKIYVATETEGPIPNRMV
jgi:hypothetical protein